MTRESVKEIAKSGEETTTKAKAVEGGIIATTWILVYKELVKIF